MQEKVEATYAPFPLLHYGELQVRQMKVDLHPHAYLGKVQGCSSWLTAANGGFSTVSGMAPTFILESKS